MGVHSVSASTIAAAVILGAASGASVLQTNVRGGTNLTAMYEDVNPSIVKIHTDSGSGSGFLVRTDGLLATNHHVVRNSRYVAAEFPNGRKVTADIVLLDAKNDVAILKVNQSVTAQLKPLNLLPSDKDANVKAGISAVAFGSPLSQTFLMTQGIVSKVEPGVLLGDFLIQPGNSGGPLVTLDGDVIGINTFGEARTSGAVRVNVLRADLSSAELLTDRLTEPSDEQLPTASKARFPTDLLKSRVLGETLDVRRYRFDGGRFLVTALTPVLVAKANIQDDLKQAANRYQRRGKKIKDERYDPVDEPFYEWVRSATSYLDSVVTFEIKPEYGQTTGSALASALAGVSAGLNHTAATPTRQTYEFKAEFLDFKVFKDGQWIRPITPGRAITSESERSYMYEFVDEAYSGMYTYAPDVFMTGDEFRFEIYDARQPNVVHKSVTFKANTPLIQQLRQDFQGVSKAQNQF